MEGLVKCSRVLYDNEISKKMKEITNLKKQLNGPKVLFKDMDESWVAREEVAKEIEKTLTEYIMGNWHESNSGFFCEDVDLPDSLEHILFNFTKDKEWSYKTGYILHDLITTIYNSLKDAGIIDFSDEDSANLIAAIIVKGVNNHLHEGDGLWGGAILDDCCVFKCNDCGKIDNWKDGGICMECHEKETL